MSSCIRLPPRRDLPDTDIDNNVIYNNVGYIRFDPRRASYRTLSKSDFLCARDNGPPVHILLSTDIPEFMDGGDGARIHCGLLEDRKHLGSSTAHCRWIARASVLFLLAQIELFISSFTSAARYSTNCPMTNNKITPKSMTAI